jgi:glycerol-3-phosphate dehydrogenase (NAD(P)+)
MKNTISIIGAGNWGTTLAITLSRKGLPVTLHSVFPEHSRAMLKDRENKLFLKGARFPKALAIEPSLTAALASEIIILAIPVKYIKSVLKKIAKQKVALKGKILVSVSKGIESASLKRVSQLIDEQLSVCDIAVLSGPNIAREVLEGVPSASTLVCKNKNIGRDLQLIFTTPTFRVYLNDDMAGVELGGALKNIIAVACGISDGLGFGSNTKSALVTRGLAEITRLGKAFGAKPSTFWGISGLGDLVTTCFSQFSRNRLVGERIAKGESAAQIIKKMNMVAEGVTTVKSAYRLSQKLSIDMPITREVYLVIYKNKSPLKAVSDLMNRPLKPEK